MLPRLLHPVPVFIRKKDVEFTAAYDHNLHEPIGQVRREQKPIRLMAQVRINDTDAAQATQGPITETSTGYLLFLTRDLDDARITIERGDQIVQIGEDDFAREVDYYIIKTQWRGHYPRAKGPTLMKAFFEDRHPSRLTNDGRSY
jgi:hypothetical protein